MENYISEILKNLEKTTIDEAFSLVNFMCKTIDADYNWCFHKNGYHYVPFNIDLFEIPRKNRLRTIGKLLDIQFEFINNCNYIKIPDKIYKLHQHDNKLNLIDKDFDIMSEE